jgi:DNA-binding PadR family transcriptional regulator
MARRSGVLEFAVLGLLHESPMHGYELRKRLNGVLGSFRAISYGSLYPCLKQLLAAGYLTEQGTGDAGHALSGKRARIVYTLTAEGKERFQEQLEQTGPESWEDEPFAARLAFFGRTDAEVRLRILEGRRSRLEERTAALRQSLTRTRERVDTYTLQLQQHGLEGVEREVRWLSELIETESRNARRGDERQTTDTPGSDRAGAIEDTGAGRRPSIRG